MPLETYGWNERLRDAFEDQPDGRKPGRVASGHQLGYRLYTEGGEVDAIVAGVLYHKLSPEELPTVGDWVAYDEVEDQNVIEAVLPRHSQFVRKVAGERGEPQVLAANVDTAFLLMALDDDYNLRRMERYLLALKEGGTNPVVVLNKADTCEDPAEKAATARARALDTPVHVISALHRQGLEALDPYLEEGRTIALFGSSGVGKSTLLNALADQELARTGEIREDDSKGRHTTTHRELFLLPSGALALDTPGLRELQLWAGEEALDEVFADIAELSAGCKFSDCTHAHEPGCAVRDAVKPERLHSYHKLKRELEQAAALKDKWARREQKRRDKIVQRNYRKRPKR